MALARWQATIVDDKGNIVPSANVEVRRETVGQPLVSLYSDRDGASALGNPFVADAEGFAAFHVIGGAYRIRAHKEGFERIWRYVGIGRGSEADVTGLLPRGAWLGGSPATIYNIGDLVTHQVGSPGTLYLFASLINDNDNNEPDAATPGDTAAWMFVGEAVEGPQGPSGVGDLYDLALSPIIGKPQDGETVLRHQFTSQIEFPIDMVGSRASAETASDGAAVFSIQKNDSEFAELTFSASATGVFSSTGSPAIAVTFDPGDVLKIIAPSPQDANLADVSITLLGNR